MTAADGGARWLGAVLKHLFFWLLVRPLVLLALGLNVRHRERLPRRGPAILAANHNSHLDTMVLMVLLHPGLLTRARPVAAADYFLANRLVAWFSLRVVGILPVERGGARRDGDPLRLASQALTRGEIVILFPEGSRGEPERMAELKSGIGHLAMRHPEVPVVPVFLHGLGKTLPKGSAVPVPFFCDVFVGEALRGGETRFAGEPRKLVRALGEAIDELRRAGGFPEWT
ncbi:MAG: lysophospholipid acyltransferase family protein [Thermoanaerobaculia bacterium]|nr:lysophospholipid acyltransferase family protein [Thermoanaerobaculia bacterium]